MFKKLVIMSLLSVSSLYLHAGIMASSTRLVYVEGENQKSLMLVNTNKYSVLTQLWVDDGEVNPDYKDAPFVVIPPVFSLKPEEIKGVTIIYNGMRLPKDRESVFWLNLYEIPAVRKTSLEQDYLNLAMNMQMKIFYRPKSLTKFDLIDVQKKLKFSFVETENSYVIKAENPTPYYISIMNINLLNKNHKSKLNNEIENMIYDSYLIN